MRRNITTAVAVLSAFLCGTLVLAQTRSFTPKNGFVPDEKTAVSVGLAVLEPIYGKDEISAEQPFSAKLKNGIWAVTGTFPRGQRFGGVAEVRISKKDGCILSVTHGQ